MFRTTLVLALVFSASSAFAVDLFSTHWNEPNNPSIFDANYQTVFDRLPLNAKLDKTPWTGWYWPNKKAGIAARWNAKEPQFFNYNSPSFEKLRAMTVEELKELSPAEKYDIFMGHYDYPTVREVWGRTSSWDPIWQGLCHGAAPASIYTEEPGPVTLVNRDGIAVPFGSADIKALLSFFYAWHSKSPSRQVGHRCNLPYYRLPIFRGTPDCADVNPGTFHIILANQIGIKKQSFISEMEPGREVWNHSVYAYESTIEANGSVPANASPGAVRRVLVSTKMFAADSVEPTWEPIAGTDKAKALERQYKYWLDLDSAGRIVGGEWETLDHPDFFWMKEADQFTGAWSGLNEIYPASIQRR